MAKFNVGDRFYFPVQEDGDYEACWNKTGVIEGIQNVFDDVFADIILDNGLKRGCLLRRLQPIEEARFTKDDLKTGMLVQTQNGNWYMVQLNTYVDGDSIYRDVIVNLSSGNYLCLRNYSIEFKELCGIDSLNFTKIVQVRYIGDIFRAVRYNTPIEFIQEFKILWERPKENPKVNQLESLCLKLESQLEDAREELQKIKAIKPPNQIGVLSKNEIKYN